MTAKREFDLRLRIERTDPHDQNGDLRIRRFLKHALRSWGMRAVRLAPVEPDEVPIEEMEFIGDA